MLHNRPQKNQPDSNRTGLSTVAVINTNINSLLDAANLENTRQTA
ncbi:hypothetical protein SAMN04488524_0212 [Pedobacter africanus]|uniref:Uncharacterized protein n=1 Tax=Pedobacter africanus TaxID=151894 RepID=A0A1W1YWY5_9SPHI|nr:hypothetical protein SAMN04488524_0212 [Pedobacter africanus]